MSLNAWNLAIDQFIDVDVPAEVERFQRIISTAALQKLVLKTPVLTGRARGAWMVTVDSTTDEMPPVDPDASKGRGKKGRAAASGSAAIGAGVGVINGARAYSSIVIQNNVEYIEDLEEGGSRAQAPNGMLAITVAELQAVFR